MKGGIGKAGQEQSQGEVKSVLEEAPREGGRRILEPAVEGEVAEYAERHGGQRDDKGHRLVVRDGHLPERELVTGTGPVRQSRVRDRRPERRFACAPTPPSAATRLPTPPRRSSSRG